MGKMKDLYMDEMEKLHEIYLAEKESGHEANDGKVEAAQKEGRLEDRLEEAQGQKDRILGAEE